MKSPSISSEVRNPPEGGVTGDTSGRFHIEAPWTCEDCPQNLTVNMNHPSARRMFRKHIIEFYSKDGELQVISTLPERCQGPGSCDTRYRKHKRTTKAIRAVFYHPSRMYQFEDTWCFVSKTKYRHIKLITLEHTTAVLDFDERRVPAPLEPLGEGRGRAVEDRMSEFAQHHLSELKEKFRRYRKKVFWQNLVKYGRWFAEVTWTVHYADGSKTKPTQWMPTSKELEGAIEVSIHPHLHVVACARFMDKEQLTDWWDYGTHIRATDRWMVCKDYLTKYVNKQQLPGRHQGTFGSVKK